MDDSNFTMPVAPMYGNGGGFGSFGNDGWWIILLLLCGWGNGFGGFGGGAMWPMMGMGMMDGGFGLYPWLNNSEHISDGFRDQQTNTAIAGIQNSITSGFGDVQLGIAGVNQNICQTGNGIVSAVTNGFNSAEVAANARQIANMQQNFGLQSAVQSGFSANAAATADLKYTVASEACADRAALTQGIQTVLDKLCALELDGYKREADNLRQQLNMAQLQASQTAQTAQIKDGQIASVNSLVTELRSCPIPAQPVYGSQPIFTCGGNGVGCGCNGGF